MMQLISMSIEPRHEGGLRLPEVKFGRFLTHLHGANGSGKTAVMCSLYWVLGGARRVDEPLWSKCLGARLTLITATGATATIFRSFSAQFIAWTEVDGIRTEFSDEATWSEALSAMLGIKSREWLTKRDKKVVGVYLSVLLPAFAIDQDKGWSLPYAPFSNQMFVEDQPQEVIRLLLNIPPKHDPKRESHRNTLIETLTRLDQNIASRERVTASLVSELPSHVTAKTLQEDHQRLMAELQRFDSVLMSTSELDASLLQRLNDAKAAKEAALRESNIAVQRRNALDRLMEEGIADLDLVGTNEVAANAFRSFCGNPHCQFFAGGSEPESYGRRVLYLRDQFKDIKIAMQSADGKVSVAAGRLAEAEINLVRVQHEYDTALRAKASDKALIAIRSLANALATTSRYIALSEQVDVVRGMRDALVAQRDGAHEDLSNHDKASSRQKASAAAAAGKLRDAIRRWLAVLKASDNNSVGIDAELRVTVGGNVLADRTGPSGSSRLRIILAYHAALLEVSFDLAGCHPNLLLLDSPKQHEINPDDFTSYLAELRRVFAPKGVQVVISSRTSMPIEAGDGVWTPVFLSGDNQPKYLEIVDKTV